MTAPDQPANSPNRLASGSVLLGSIAAIVAFSAFAPEPVVDVLAYFRSKLPVDAWRAISAHLVHLNPQHALMNAAALVLLVALLGRVLSAWQWLAFWLSSSVVVSVGLWWLVPELERYVGASGVLHGVAALGGMVMWSHHRLEASMLLGGLAAKIAWELRFGATSATAELIGGNVIEQAHWLGAGYGALLGAGYLIFRRPSNL